MNGNKNMEYIGFKTSGDWTVEDWNTCLVSVSKIYNIFLSMDIIKKFEKSIPDSFEFNKLTVSNVIKNIQTFVDDSAKLRIHEIKMASPGGFSLQGSGEIIKEVRKWMKNVLEVIGKTTKKEEAKTTKIIAEAKKTDAETELMKQEVLGEKLKNIVIILNLLKKYPEFKTIFCEDNEQESRKIDQKIIIEYLLDGISPLLVLEKDGKLIDIQKNIHHISKK